MNFFAAQERARKSSQKLVLWFAMCLSGVVVTMYFVVIAALKMSGRSNAYDPASNPDWWHTETFLWTASIVGGIILIGSFSKLAQLSSGGGVVARNLGGRQVDPSTTDLRERRLLNVVEEMAIASGAPVPDVWIMDQEQGINAFAAGTDPANAAIGVTRGTLERLSRSELQGVVAHEFSHILNGDMKLNMRLSGWIFGLVMLTTAGRMFLESLRFMRGSRNSKGNGGSIVLVIVLIGIAIWVVGSIGTLFARILQASISRQREFLADASAVQFTRYPEGIAGALKKIGGYPSRGKLTAAKAGEVSHMFFASCSLSSMLATHPPLDQRIKAIDPNWNGKMLEGMADPVELSEFGEVSSFSGSQPVSAVDVNEPLGDSAHVSRERGAALLGALPPAEISLDSAKSLLFGLLIKHDDQTTAKHILNAHGYDEQMIDRALQWSRELEAFNTEQKLTRVDQSLPELRRMAMDEARNVVKTCHKLAEADKRIDLFEFMLTQVIRRHIEIGVGLEPVSPIRYRKLVVLEHELSNLLALYASLAGDPKSLQPAIDEYRAHTGRPLPALDHPDLSATAKALLEMDAASPLVKSQILRLCSLVVIHDNQIDCQETQLLRATAEAIGAQIPPMVRAG